MAIQKRTAISALLLASSPLTNHAFSTQSLLSIKRNQCSIIVPTNQRRSDTVLLMSYMDEMNRRGNPMMGGPPPPGQPGMGRGPPPPPGGESRDMGSGSSRGNSNNPNEGGDMNMPRNQHLDRHASDYLDELRAKRTGSNTIPEDPNQGRSFSANNPPGAFSVPNAGNTSGQSRRPEYGNGRTGLGGLASGVSTPNDKYNEGPPRSQWERGGYRGGPAGGPNSPMMRGRNGGQPNFNDRGGYGNNFRGDMMRGGGPPPPSLQRDPREIMGGMPPPPRGPDPREMDMLQMQDEIERLRTENAMLKRSAKDLMNSFNELSNRLFDVDESLKKVANVFPSEGELESLEWLLKK